MQRYASLRQGLVGAWCPSVSGPFGYRLPDLSGYGNHGTLTNMDPPNDWVISGGKGALDFDGSNDYVSFGNIATNTVAANSNITIAAWFKLFGVNKYQAIVTKWNLGPSNASWQLYISNTNKVEGTIVFGDNSSQTGITGITSLNSQMWYHACLVKNNKSVDLFLNSISDATTQTASVSGIGTTTADLRIGGRNLNSGLDLLLQGQLDDIRIYNRALSEQEIRLLASERGIGLKPERQRNRYLVPALPSRNRSSRFLGFPS